jgi:nitrous oxidase accessory protein NosD
MFAASMGRDRGRKEERLRSRLPRVSEKINLAKPGDRILLPKGFYDEALIINQPVELVGEGKRSDVVIQSANSSVVTVTGAGARLTNLTIRQQGGQGWHGRLCKT